MLGNTSFRFYPFSSFLTKFVWSLYLRKHNLKNHNLLCTSKCFSPTTAGHVVFPLICVRNGLQKAVLHSKGDWRLSENSSSTSTVVSWRPSWQAWCFEWLAALKLGALKKCSSTSYTLSRSHKGFPGRNCNRSVPQSVQCWFPSVLGLVFGLSSLASKPLKGADCLLSFTESGFYSSPCSRQFAPKPQQWAF